MKQEMAATAPQQPLLYVAERLINVLVGFKT
jgi:hypothetical protein